MARSIVIIPAANVGTARQRAGNNAAFAAQLAAPAAPATVTHYATGWDVAPATAQATYGDIGTVYDADAKTTTQVLAEAGLTQSTAPTVEDATRTTINDRLDQALAPLKAFVDQAKPGTAAGQASAAYDGVRLLCRVAIGLIRLSRNRLDSAD